MFNREIYEKRVNWITDARFGLFIHWGLYSIPARGEWVQSDEEITKEKYASLIDEFDGRDCQPREWVRLAKEAGMKYAIFTAKHHDGFCLYDTKTTSFNSLNSPSNRDFVREFVDACREFDIHPGLYYSLIDWSHDDFPHFGDRYHPMRNNPDDSNEHRNFEAYLEYMHEQVKELCSQYGKLDLLWFDFSYDDLRDEKWAATKLVKMVRSYQPDILINNRLEVSGEGLGSLATKNPTSYHGDFVSPEKIIPPNGIVDEAGAPMVWESCITMNNNWGYNASDSLFKPTPMLIHKLVECVSKGGNMLLNIGPDANGNVPEQSKRTLKEIGQWMGKNAESIYECGVSNIPIPENGRITQKENILYYHIFQNSIGPFPLIGIDKSKILSIRKLFDGSEVPLSTNWTHSDYPTIAFADLGSNPILPDPIDTVLKIILEK